MIEVEDTLRRLLEAVTIRARVGHDRVQYASAAERDAILAEYAPFLEADMGLARECLRQAQLIGISDVHQALHTTVVDHEMLDEAVEYAERRR